MGLLDAIRPRVSALASAFGDLPKKPPKGPVTAAGFTAPSAHEELVDYLAERADHRDWFTAMRAADLGDTSRMIDVFSDARDRDGFLNGVASKRAISMMGRPIVFKPQDGLENDKEALAAAQLVRETLLVRSLGFRSQLQHLSSASLNGYGALEKIWTGSREGEYVPHLVDRRSHPNRFGFHRDTLELGFYVGGRYGWEIEPLSNYPDSFISHLPVIGQSDYPWRRGALRSCIIPSFIKRNGIKYWLTLAERFGMPQVYATTDLDADDESTSSTKALLERSLKSLSRYWYAVFGKEVEIHKIEGSGEADAEVHKALTEWAKIEIAISILGQNLTTEVQGGSFAASETHRWVADDIFIADAVELAETITQQLCEPIIRFNMPGAPVPICEINTGRKQVFKTEHYLNGLCNADEMRHTMGHPAKPEGTGGDTYLPPQTGLKVRGAAPGPAPDEPDDGTSPADDESGARRAL